MVHLPRMFRLHQAALALALLAAATAHAEDDERTGRAARLPLLPKYQQECAACHLAYPPGLLPPASWQRLMSGLEHHFGTDASLDAASTAQITRWLTANATSERRSGRDTPPEDRITRSRWFVHEHDEIGAAVWKRASVRSPANCAACHVGAERGDFSEHTVRIPR